MGFAISHFFRLHCLLKLKSTHKEVQEYIIQLHMYMMIVIQLHVYINMHIGML